MSKPFQAQAAHCLGVWSAITIEISPDGEGLRWQHEIYDSHPASTKINMRGPWRPIRFNKDGRAWFRCSHFGKQYLDNYMRI